MSVIEVTTNAPVEAPADHVPVMRGDASAYCEDHDLSLHEVPSGGWLIRQYGASAEEQAVLGCVDEHADGYELMEVLGGFRWSTFETLLAAVVHLFTETTEHARAGDHPAPGAERRFDPHLDSPDAPISALPHPRR